MTNRPALLLFSTLILVLVPTLSAQTTEQQLWSPYWTVANGFQSTLEIKNNRASEPLDVSVKAYSPSGAELSLGSFHLQPRETSAIDLNKALGSLAKAQDWGTLEVSF